MRASKAPVGLALLIAVLAVLLAAASPVGAAEPTPSIPGTGYLLDWENPRDWTVPSQPPPGWAEEYRPEVRHSDGEPQVRVANASNDEPVRNGQHSVRFDLEKSDLPLHNGSRAELGAEDPVEPRGAERWYGFSIFLPNSWAYDQAPEVVMQWHQVGGDCSRGCSPPLSIITEKDQFVISQNWQNTHTPGDWTFADTPIGQYETGRWIDWVVHVKWSTGNDGVLDVWKDGQPVPGFSGKHGRTDDFGDEVHGDYMVIGVYKWPWSQGKPSDTTRRVMYVDELRVADERGGYDAVAPRGDIAQPGHLELVSGLSVSPASPIANQPTTASFVVTNDGGAPISVGYFLAGNRDQANSNRDFPASPAVTLQPGQSYTYQQSRTLSAGRYTAWPAYYDGTSWHELGERIAFTVT
jgi:Polysaccharide lyase